jgi:hypothetical protein
MHYAVNVSLAKPQDVKSTVNGKIGLSVGGDRGAVSNVQLTQSKYKEFRYIFEQVWKTTQTFEFLCCFSALVQN